MISERSPLSWIYDFIMIWFVFVTNITELSSKNEEQFKGNKKPEHEELNNFIYELLIMSFYYIRPTAQFSPDRVYGPQKG